VTRKGAERLASGHLWVYGSDVLDRSGAGPGEAMAVVDPRGRPLGTAHYSSTSQISLRLLSRETEPIDTAFFERRIAAAAEFRRRVVAGSDAYRLVYGEADLLPGLVIDRYADWLVLQTLNQGMEAAKPRILAALQGVVAPQGVVERNDVAVRRHEKLPLVSGVVAGKVPETVEVGMNGLRLRADLLKGQKTGIFLDQRENYVAAARWARGRALDCFTSTGGFALHLARSCESVEAVDSAAAALETAEANRRVNGIENVAFREANVFDLLPARRAQGRTYEMIVLDPPAFAKSRENVEAAARGYKEINLRALQLLGPGGILVTCSCSHHVSEAMLLEVVASASLDAGRRLRVLERRTQAQDHPILLTVPETHYLKCLVVEAM
jgi:23S rRNA (cytosine1962-C5)-methyltransferase